MTRGRAIVALTLIAAVGFTLRATSNAESWLWQDEAETTINSLQVLDHGYPSDTFKGKPLYENDSYLPSDDPKYAFQSTNYIGSKFERNKGWLTYYYQAAFLKVFWVSTFIARLPFLLLFPLSLFLLFLLARRLFTTHVALVAAALYALNPYSIIAERQARYFSLVVVITLFLLIALHRAVTTGRPRDYAWCAVGLTLLFYTHIVAAVGMAVFFVALHVLRRRSIRAAAARPVLATLTAVTVAALPWIIVVKFWTVFGTFSDHRAVLLWLLMLALLVIIYLLYRKAPWLTQHDFWRFSPVNYLVLFLLTLTAMKPLLVPEESLASRLFVELNPVLIVLLVLGGRKLVHAIRTKQQPLTPAVNLSLAIFFFFFINQMTPPTPKIVYDTAWVAQAVEYLDARGVDRNDPVLVSYQQLPLMLYTDYNVDLVWPVRKSYIDSYPGTVYFIFDYANLWPLLSYRDEVWKAQNLRDTKNLNFYDRFQHCTKHHLREHVFLYECPKTG